MRVRQASWLNCRVWSIKVFQLVSKMHFATLHLAPNIKAVTLFKFQTLFSFSLGQQFPGWTRKHKLFWQTENIMDMTNKSYNKFDFNSLVQFDILVKKGTSKGLISLKLKKCALCYGCYYDQKGTTLVVSLVFFMRLYDNLFLLFIIL